jgi:hypothetical protein
LFGLIGYPGGDLLEIARDICQLDSEGADPYGQLGDQLRVTGELFQPGEFFQHCVHDRNLKSG